MAEASTAAGYDPAQSDGRVIGYRNQVLYLNDRMIPILERIMADSAVPPIIVLLGDHGPDDAGPAERMAILYAIHQPGAGEQLPEQSSPVNSFRRIFNDGFSADLPSRPDLSRFSNYETPFDFQLVPAWCEPA